MKKVLFILSLFFTTISFAQLENTNWCFGVHAKVIFNPLNPTAPPTASSCAINNNPAGASYSGSGSSVSDANGQLLFYTDALSIWDKNDNEMPGGTQLFGTTDQIAGKNNSVIVAKPDHPGVYYVFAISTFVTGAPAYGRGGVHYTVVNTNLAGSPGPSAPNGDVIAGLKNIALNNENNIPLDFDYGSNTGLRTYTTKIATTLHADGDKVWVTIFTQYNQTGISELHALNYLVTANGFYDGTTYYPDGTNPKPVTSLALDNTIYNETTSSVYGEIKISPDRQHLADIAGNCVLLYNFNDQTGVIGYDKTVFLGGAGNPWGTYCTNGVEFSPDNNFLYFTSGDNIFQNGFSGTSNKSKKYVRIFQYALSKNTTEQIGQIEIVDSSQGGPIDHIVTPLPVTYPCGLQIGIDNKIYACVSYPTIGELYYLGIIQQPNVPSTGCQFIITGLHLQAGTYHLLTLPHWVHKPIMHIWPKIYESQESNGIKLDNTGNLFSVSAGINMANNVNHYGAITNVYGTYSVQYNTTTGISNWFGSGLFPTFSFSNGVDQFLNNSASVIYKDGTTGNPASGPSYLTASEKVFAEDNGVLITHDPYTHDLNVKSSSISNTITIPSYSGYAWYGIDNWPVYNPATKKLYFSRYAYHLGNQTYLLYIYQLNSNNTLTLVNNPLLNQVKITQVNSADEIFVYNNGTLQKYDYITGTYTPVVIPNFNNTSLEYVMPTNQIAEDRIITINSTDHMFYCINTVTKTSKKIAYTPPSSTLQFYTYYAFNGNDVFISGEFMGPGFTIGNQSFPLLGTASAFVTKFNLQTDFSLRSPSENFAKSHQLIKEPISSVQQNDKVADQAAIFTAVLSPNPAKNSLIINLKQKDGAKAELFNISVTNSLGIVMLIKNTTQNTVMIDIAAFKAGTYYVTISTGKGDKLTHVFVKE
jgi:hypothetical protein